MPPGPEETSAGALRQLRSPSGLFWLLASAGVAVWCCFVPLFNRLGYAFCLALAPVAAVGAAHLSAALVTRYRASDEPLLLATREPPRALAMLLARAMLVGLALLALPLLAISLNALRVRNCAPLAGFGFFLLMPVLGTLFASSVGTVWALLIPRRRLALLAAILTILFFWFWAGWRIYAGPAVFAYDPFVGYFPGVIYDEDLGIRAPLLLYRAHNLLWLAGLLALAAPLFDATEVRLRLSAWRSALRLTVFGAALLTGGIATLLAGPALGFDSGLAHIRHQLGGVRLTPHFEIIHSRGLERHEVDLIAEDHEFRYHQLKRALGVEPAGRVRSYVFESSAQKRQLMGAARTQVAKPWRREIFLQKRRFPHNVLKHELVHVFAGAFGDPLLGASVGWRRLGGLLPTPTINFGLIEGTAVAVDWPAHGESTVHEQTAALSRLGLAPPITELLGAGFFGHAGGRAYTTAGSFCRYLIDTAGVAPLRRAYRDGGTAAAFARHFGADVDALAAGWTRWLAELSVPRRELVLAEERYRQPSIFRRSCPHAVARLAGRADQLTARQRADEAVPLRREICAFDPGDPGRQLELSQTLEAAGRLAEAKAAAQQVLAHASTSKPLARAASEQLGDLHWLAGELRAARAAYHAAADPAASAGARRLRLLKREALEPPQAAARDLLRRYLVGELGLARHAVRDLHLAYELDKAVPGGLGLYLVGKQLAARGLCDEALGTMRRALAAGLPSADFEIEALRVRGRCAYLAGRTFEAGEIYRRLSRLPGLPSGLRLVAADWQQRVAWRLGLGDRQSP